MSRYECFAAQAGQTERLYPISEGSYRSCFQRDRDRILYSKEFRRLNGKTQVFAIGFDDSMRTRLTHTLEVAQIAKTISSALGLEVDLTEAIALGHDVGHTPFGHVVERLLNNILNGCIPLYGYDQRLNDNEKGFKHNLQSVRVVSQLEFHNEKEPGLNLTKFTMWGLAHHTSTEPKECEYWNATNEQCSVYSSHSSCQRSNLSLGFYNSTLRYNDKQILNDCEDWNFESFVVAISDEIAQRHHDIEDSLCAGIVESNEVVNCVLNMSVWSIEEQSILNELNSCNSIEKIIPQISKVIVNKYVNETINMFRKSFEEIKKSIVLYLQQIFQKKDVRSGVDFFITEII